MESNHTVNVALIGLSMSGKTTFINNLLCEEAFQVLNAISSTNTNGQTKISTNYIITPNANNDIEISDIEWNLDVIDNDETMLPIIEIFKNNLGLELDPSHLNNITYNSIDIANFYHYIINNVDVTNKKAIRSIHLTVKANDAISDLLKNNNLDAINIKDSRGLMDLDLELYKKFVNDSENNKESDQLQFEQDNDFKTNEAAQQVLDDFGISDIDICIFMSREGLIDSFNSSGVNDIYSRLLQILINKYPFINVIRTKYSNPDFSDIKDFLKEYKDPNIERKDPFTNILTKDFYCEMVLPEIKNDLENYRTYAFNIIEKIIRNYLLIQNRFALAYNFFEQYTKDPESKINRKINEISYSIFGEYFSKKLAVVINMRNIILFTPITTTIDKIVKSIANEEYKGGLVGTRGGITYGNYIMAAYILRVAYDANCYIDETIINSIDNELKEFILSQNSNNKDNIDEQIAFLKVGIRIYYTKEEDRAEYLGTLQGRLIPREYLEAAHSNTRETFDLSIDNHEHIHIGKYLRDLEEAPTNLNTTKEIWDQNKHYLSVIKFILWDLICRFRKIPINSAITTNPFNIN